MISLLHLYHILKSKLVTGTAFQDTDNVEDIVKPYILDEPAYEKLCQLMLDDMNQGLQPKTNAAADLKMLPTYVRSLPNGEEHGSFLALDLGGTNFRVLLIELKDAHTVNMKNKIYPISEHTMTGPGTHLFDHIASCIHNFTKDHKIVTDPKNPLPLGFTFSFPCKQEGLNVGRLLQWTKGFNCAGVVGENVVQMLHEAIKRRGDLHVKCVALLNDTVGCLMSCAFHDHDTQLGIILGTGTNACYMERLDRVGTWDGDLGEPAQVIINTEWGAFGNNGALDFIRTDADRSIDTESINPGKQIYEKMISGMYMGELVRLVMVDCVKHKCLFNGQISKTLETPHKFFTKYVSEIEDDKEGAGFPNTQQVLEEIGIENVTEADCHKVQYICSAVSTRAAYLASAGIATLINRISKPRVTVAVDGSLYRYHPHFHNLMMEKISQLLKPGLTFHIHLSDDGSGIGAALVAAVTARVRFESFSRDASRCGLSSEEIAALKIEQLEKIINGDSGIDLNFKPSPGDSDYDENEALEELPSEMTSQSDVVKQNGHINFY